jgi:hypothetical protein
VARDFDGVDDRIALGDIAVDGLTTFAIACWLNADIDNTFQMLFSKNSSSSSQVEIYLENQTIQFVISTGSVTFGGTTSILTTATWHHALFWYDGGGALNADRLKIYWNGATQTLSFSGTIPATLPTNAASATVGARSGGTLPVDGRLAEYAIWTGLPGGFTPDAAATILASGYSPAHLRLNGLHYYPLIGRHSPEIDPWGGNSGTVTGAVVSAHPRIITPRRRWNPARTPTPLPYTLFAQACL